MIQMNTMPKKNQSTTSSERFKATQDKESFLREAFLIEYTPETLRLMRNYRKLTQAHLAKRANTSSDYISELERGICSPSTVLLGRLSVALEVIFFK